MIDLLQITNDLGLASRCDNLPGMRLWVDLERLGKAERQAGRSTFISTHALDDVARVRSVLHRSRLMVRVNPLNASTDAEVDAVIGQGADLIMLPMFHTAVELRQFSQMVDGRVPIVALLETAAALTCIDDWVGTSGLYEVFVGMNDLHLSMGCNFMFEPLALGHVDRVAAIVRRAGLRFGFGGIARLDEGLLPGRDVLAEHLRLGSRAVILSRTFHASIAPGALESGIAELRATESALEVRTPGQCDADRARIAKRILEIAATAAHSVRLTP